jgi:uncharacterized protein (TIGR02118 family)
MIKVISVVYKKPDISREDFYRYWKDTHGPLVAQALPGMKKYVQNHLIQVPGYEYEGDGLIETWYDDVNAFQQDMAFTRRTEAKALGADAAKILEVGKLKIWIVEEHVIKQ